MKGKRKLYARLQGKKEGKVNALSYLYLWDLKFTAQLSGKTNYRVMVDSELCSNVGVITFHRPAFLQTLLIFYDLFPYVIERNLCRKV